MKRLAQSIAALTLLGVACGLLLSYRRFYPNYVLTRDRADDKWLAGGPR